MTKRTSFPHPVIGNADDVDHTLPDYHLTPDIAGDTITFTFGPSPLTLGHDTLDRLVEEGNALWFARIHCARTYYRQEHPLSPTHPVILVSTDLVEGAVRCELFVIASRDIENYQPNKMHPDYASTDFAPRKGEVLACCGEFPAHIDPRFDPMAADARSFVEFRKDEDEQDGSVWVNYDEDVIAINIPHGQWDLVAEMNALSPDVVHVSLILPVLMKAIDKRNDFENRTWSSRLDAVIRARGLREDDSFMVAQEILDRPVLRGLTHTKRLTQEP